MNVAKIRLSKAEMALAENAEVILTKNDIMQKGMLLLGMLQEKQQDWINTQGAYLPVEIINSSPKISRGENYQGLPYLVLDYPRFFDKDDILMMRSMFWMGNFFSTTLHISGAFAGKYAERIGKNKNLLGSGDFYVCVNEDQWQHHFSEENYKAIQSLDVGAFNRMLHERSFIKIAKKIPVRAWEDAPVLLYEDFETLMRLLVD